jgi:gas vesicle protein
MNKNTKLMLGVVAVAAAGVAIGMLLAKSKGEEARTTKKDVFSNLAEKVKDLLIAGQQILAEKTGELHEDLNTVKDDLKTTAKHTGKFIS